MSAELAKNNYHGTDKIQMRERDILDRWTALLQKLENRRRALMALNDLMGMLRDIDTLQTEFQQLEVATISAGMKIFSHNSFIEFSAMTASVKFQPSYYSIRKFSTIISPI